MGNCQYIQSIQLWEWTHQRKGQSWMILLEKFKTKVYSENGGTGRFQGLSAWWNAEIHSALYNRGDIFLREGRKPSSSNK